MDAADFRNQLDTAIRRQLQAFATREARRIVRSVMGVVEPGQPITAPQPVAPRARRVRNRARKTTHRQFAPKGSWLALGEGVPRVPATGRLAEALDVAKSGLASGPAERAVLTQLMMDANPSWTSVTASGCISRLVTRGRLVVVTPPRQH